VKQQDERLLAVTSNSTCHSIPWCSLLRCGQVPCSFYRSHSLRASPRPPHCSMSGVGCRQQPC
jgi:hypothetical protein